MSPAFVPSYFHDLERGEKASFSSDGTSKDCFVLSPGICTSLPFRNGAVMVCSSSMESEKLKATGNRKSLDPSLIHRLKTAVQFCYS